MGFCAPPRPGAQKAPCATAQEERQCGMGYSLYIELSTLTTVNNSTTPISVHT
jgi:hypothetical protein